MGYGAILATTPPPWGRCGQPADGGYKIMQSGKNVRAVSNPSVTGDANSRYEPSVISRETASASPQPAGAQYTAEPGIDESKVNVPFTKNCHERKSPGASTPIVPSV